MTEGIKVPKVADEAKAASSEAAGPAAGLPAPVPGPPSGGNAITRFVREYIFEVRRGIAWLRAAPKPEVGVTQRVSRGLRAWWKLSKARIGVLVVIGIIFGAYTLFSTQAGNTPLLAAPVTPGGGGGPGANHVAVNFSDSVGENSDKDIPLTANVTSFKTFTVILTWTDEPSSVTQVNQPDSMSLAIKAPNGSNYTAGPSANPQGGTGRVAWALPSNETGMDFGGTAWTITVEGGTMGDYTRPTGRACLICPVDNLNRFELSVDFTW